MSEQRRERPILFQGAMVRAILSGQKTQTRRVFKQATGPSLSVGMTDDEPGVAELSWLYGDGPGYDVHEATKRVPCPYGKPGDRLWVREAFAKIDGQTRPWIETDYKATYKHGDRLGDTLGVKKRWTPSIHMPRSASRITLEVTGVRVERLQAISEADCWAEGIEAIDGMFDVEIHAMANRIPGKGFEDAVPTYACLWESINSPGSWDLNPWVWVVEFRRAAP